MPTDESLKSPPDLAAFLEYVANRLGDDARTRPLDDVVASFNRYREQLIRFRDHIRPSLEQAERGEAGPLDDVAFWKKVEEQLEERGVAS